MPGELTNQTYTISENEKAIINVGSVGQPRDYDARASYVIVDGFNVQFVRVPYDVETAAKKIRAVPQLHDYLADRLMNGQ
jgi:diadenosine tetraphosphatase ApaH/serine/threonine PP2A family protein phosphatase